MDVVKDFSCLAVLSFESKMSVFLDFQMCRRITSTMSKRTEVGRFMPAPIRDVWLLLVSDREVIQRESQTCRAMKMWSFVSRVLQRAGQRDSSIVLVFFKNMLAQELVLSTSSSEPKNLSFPGRLSR